MKLKKRFQLAWNIFRAEPDEIEEQLDKLEEEYTDPVPNDRDVDEIIGEQNKRMYSAKKATCELKESFGYTVGYNYDKLYDGDNTEEYKPKCGNEHAYPCGIDPDCSLTDDKKQKIKELDDALTQLSHIQNMIPPLVDKVENDMASSRLAELFGEVKDAKAIIKEYKR